MMKTEEEEEEEETVGTQTEGGDGTISLDILGEEIITTETAVVDLT